MKFQIILTISIALIISTSSLYFMIDWYDNTVNVKRWHEEFFPQNQDESKKIFILGSSEVGRLNATLIQENIAENGLDYDVFNLAYQGDRPSKRLKFLGEIIDEKPEVVIYGVGFRDFEKKPSQGTNMVTNFQTNTKPENLLPDPKDLLNTFIDSKIEELGFAFFNPKLVSLKLTDVILNSKDLETIPDVKSNTPFFTYGEHQVSVKKFSNLKRSFEIKNPSFNGYVSLEQNKDFKKLKNIISKLQDNNIKVVIFTTPIFKLMLDNIPQSDKDLFNIMMSKLEKNHNVNVYFLHDKYSDLEIWNDIHHIAVNKDITIFNDDITEIIFEETKN